MTPSSGPAEAVCSLCGGRGWYCRPHDDDETQYSEVYCDCDAGKAREEREGEMGEVVRTSTGAVGVTHPVLHLYQNVVVDWFAAESAEDAAEFARGWYAENGFDEADIADHRLLELVQVPDDKVLGCVDEEDDDGETVRRTALEWANLNGRGFWASTEY